MWSGGGRGGGRCQPLAVTTSEIEERRLTAWRPSPFSHLDRRRHGNGEWGLSGTLLLVNVCGVASFGASDFWGAKNVSNFGACSVASNLTRQPGQGVSATTFSLSLFHPNLSLATLSLSFPVSYLPSRPLSSLVFIAYRHFDSRSACVVLLGDRIASTSYPLLAGDLSLFHSSSHPYPLSPRLDP
jgi:hypothetical protein